MRLFKKGFEEGFATIAAIVLILAITIVVLIILAKQGKFGSSVFEKIKGLFTFS